MTFPLNMEMKHDKSINAGRKEMQQNEKLSLFDASYDMKSEKCGRKKITALSDGKTMVE